MTAMLVCYAREDRAVGFVFGFAVVCLASSGYGCLQGAWPFGVVEVVWAGVACAAAGAGWKRTPRPDRESRSGPRRGAFETAEMVRFPGGVVQ